MKKNLASPHTSSLALSEELPQLDDISLDILRYAFFGTLSYEAGCNINQFLTSLQGYLSLNINSINLGENTRKHLQRLKQNSETIQYLSSSLQDLFTSLSDSNLQQNQLSETLQDIIHLCQILFPSQCTVKNESVSLTSKVDVPESKLKEILLYLLWHAKEHIHEAGTIRVYSPGKGQKSHKKNYIPLQIDVQNTLENQNGSPSLPQNNISTELPKQISLHLAHKLTLQYGCIMEYNHSSPGRIHYNLHLPLLRDQQNGGSEVKMLKQENPPSLKTLRIILLEDQELISDFIKERLRMDGHFVEVFNNGLMLKETLQKRELTSYNLFMLDVFVPGISGLEVAHYIRSIDKNSRILFYSALTSEFTITRQFSLDEQTKFLPKPFKTEEMMQKITELTSIPIQKTIPNTAE